MILVAGAGEFVVFVEWKGAWTVNVGEGWIGEGQGRRKEWRVVSWMCS